LGQRNRGSETVRPGANDDSIVVIIFGHSSIGS
jgi:hypothetical protein